MMKKFFFLTMITFIAGCVSSVKHPINIKKSFVKIHKSVEIKICGENSKTKTAECKKLMTMNSTGSGGVVWNEREIGRAIYHRSEYKFDQPVKEDEMPPFPSAPTYDAKAWKFIQELSDKKGTTLFWNVGA